MMNSDCRCDFKNRCDNYKIKCNTCKRNRNTNYFKLYDNYVVTCDCDCDDIPLFEMEYEGVFSGCDDSTYETIEVIETIYDSYDSDF